MTYRPKLSVLLELIGGMVKARKDSARWRMMVMRAIPSPGASSRT